MEDIFESKLKSCTEIKQEMPWIKGSGSREVVIAFEKSVDKKHIDKLTSSVKLTKDEVMWYEPSKEFWNIFEQLSHNYLNICTEKKVTQLTTMADGTGNVYRVELGLLLNNNLMTMNAQTVADECEYWQRYAETAQGQLNKIARTRMMNHENQLTGTGMTCRTYCQINLIKVLHALYKSTYKIEERSAIPEEIMSMAVKIEQGCMHAEVKSIYKSSQSVLEYTFRVSKWLLMLDIYSPFSKYCTLFQRRLLKGLINPESFVESRFLSWLPELQQSEKIEEINEFTKALLITSAKALITQAFFEINPHLEHVSKCNNIELVDLSEVKQLVCANPDAQETVDKITYKENHKNYCFSLDDIINLVKTQKPINPYTGNRFATAFVEEIKSRYVKQVFEPHVVKKKQAKSDLCKMCKKPGESGDLPFSIGKLGENNKEIVQQFCSSECMDDAEELQESQSESDYSDSESESNMQLVKTRRKSQTEDNKHTFTAADLRSYVKQAVAEIKEQTFAYLNQQGYITKNLIQNNSKIPNVPNVPNVENRSLIVEWGQILATIHSEIKEGLGQVQISNTKMNASIDELSKKVDLNSTDLKNSKDTLNQLIAETSKQSLLLNSLHSFIQSGMSQKQIQNGIDTNLTALTEQIQTYGPNQPNFGELYSMMKEGFQDVKQDQQNLIKQMVQVYNMTHNVALQNAKQPILNTSTIAAPVLGSSYDEIRSINVMLQNQSQKMDKFIEASAVLSQKATNSDEKIILEEILKLLQSNNTQSTAMVTDMNNIMTKLLGEFKEMTVEKLQVIMSKLDEFQLGPIADSINRMQENLNVIRSATSLDGVKPTPHLNIDNIDISKLLEDHREDLTKAIVVSQAKLNDRPGSTNNNEAESIIQYSKQIIEQMDVLSQKMLENQNEKFTVTNANLDKFQNTLEMLSNKIDDIISGGDQNKQAITKILIDNQEELRQEIKKLSNIMQEKFSNTATDANTTPNSNANECERKQSYLLNAVAKEHDKHEILDKLAELPVTLQEILKAVNQNDNRNANVIDAIKDTAEKTSADLFVKLQNLDKSQLPQTDTNEYQIQMAQLQKQREEFQKEVQQKEAADNEQRTKIDQAMLARETKIAEQESQLNDRMNALEQNKKMLEDEHQKALVEFNQKKSDLDQAIAQYNQNQIQLSADKNRLVSDNSLSKQEFEQQKQNLMQKEQQLLVDQQQLEQEKQNMIQARADIAFQKQQLDKQDEELLQNKNKMESNEKRQMELAADSEKQKELNNKLEIAKTELETRARNSEEALKTFQETQQRLELDKQQLFAQQEASEKQKIDLQNQLAERDSQMQAYKEQMEMNRENFAKQSQAQLEELQRQSDQKQQEISNQINQLQQQSNNSIDILQKSQIEKDAANLRLVQQLQKQTDEKNILIKATADQATQDEIAREVSRVEQERIANENQRLIAAQNEEAKRLEEKQRLVEEEKQAAIERQNAEDALRKENEAKIENDRLAEEQKRLSDEAQQKQFEMDRRVAAENEQQRQEQLQADEQIRQSQAIEQARQAQEQAEQQRMYEEQVEQQKRNEEQAEQQRAQMILDQKNEEQRLAQLQIDEQNIQLAAQAESEAKRKAQMELDEQNRQLAVEAEEQKSAQMALDERNRQIAIEQAQEAEKLALIVQEQTRLANEQEEKRKQLEEQAQLAAEQQKQAELAAAQEAKRKQLAEEKKLQEQERENANRLLEQDKLNDLSEDNLNKQIHELNAGRIKLKENVYENPTNYAWLIQYHNFSVENNIKIDVTGLTIYVCKLLLAAARYMVRQPTILRLSNPRVSQKFDKENFFHNIIYVKVGEGDDEISEMIWLQLKNQLFINQSEVRIDHISKWLLTQSLQLQGKLNNKKELRNLMFAIVKVIVLKIRQFTDINATQRLAALKESITHEHNKQSQLLTYVKIRNDTPEEFSFRFKTGLDASGQVVSVQYNDLQIPMYSGNNRSLFDKQGNALMKLTYDDKMMSLEVDETKEKFMNVSLNTNDKRRVQMTQIQGTQKYTIQSISAEYNQNYVLGPFSKVFERSQNNKIVSQIAGQDILQNILNGKNAFILAWGSSGSGKTSTLIKSQYMKDGQKIQEDGIAVKMCNELASNFKLMEVRVTEFYFDNNLLSEVKTRNLEKAIVFKNKSQNWITDESQDLATYLSTRLSDKNRVIYATPNNPVSSRSHILLYMSFISGDNDKDKPKPTLIFGDFAGVENKFDCTKSTVRDQFAKIKNDKNQNFYDAHAFEKFKAKYKDIILKFGNSEVFEASVLPTVKNSVQKSQANTKPQPAVKSNSSSSTKGKNETKSQSPNSKLVSKAASKLEISKEIKQLQGILEPELPKKSDLGDKQQYNATEFENLMNLIRTKSISAKDFPKADRIFSNAVASGVSLEQCFEVLNGLYKTDNLRLDPPTKWGEEDHLWLYKILFDKSPNTTNYLGYNENTVFKARKLELLNWLIDKAWQESLTSSIVDQCSLRTQEGEFINKTLSHIRSTISAAVQQTDQVPSFVDECLPIQCNALYNECFDQSNENNAVVDDVMIADIRLKLNIPGNISLKESIKFCIFNVLNLSSNVNNPPSIPFIDMTDLTMELQRLKSVADLQDKRDKGNPSVLDDRLQVDHLVSTNTNDGINQWILKRFAEQSKPLRRLFSEDWQEKVGLYITNLKQGLDPKTNLEKLINHIAYSNATTTIGTMVFIEQMAKFGTNSAVCNFQNLLSAPAADNELDQIKNQEIFNPQNEDYKKWLIALLDKYYSRQ